MNGDYILDSNIVIDLFRKDQVTIEKIRSLKSVYIPAIVLGELYYGANKSSQTAKRIQEVEALKVRVVILDVTEVTAKHYGEMKNQLRQKGKPIPENDIWIAAIAKETNLPLLSNDIHFSEVDGISVEKLK